MSGAFRWAGRRKRLEELEQIRQSVQQEYDRISEGYYLAGTQDKQQVFW